MFKNLLLLYFLITLTLNMQTAICSSKEKSARLPLCRACKTFVESFKKGMARTKSGKFEGGDTAWEESKLGSYRTSEIRLVEIQEMVCADVKDGKDQCYALNEHHDAELEAWWFHKQADEPDLFKYFCIDTLKHCCPDLHYGPLCTPCPGLPDSVCTNNGKCKGAGTRKGNGECSCDLGYMGPSCSQCSDGHYEAYRDPNKMLCSKCHASCKGNCDQAGPSGCKECNIGWIPNEEKGCIDINECAAPTPPCKANQFCVNNEGSYKCLDCDKSCSGCTGDGPDMCARCADGYILIDNVCTDAESESRKNRVFLTRYLTYLGLCVATCIIFNKHTLVSAIIGLAVAVYITVSEYVLNTPPTPKTDSLAQQIMDQAGGSL